MNRDEGPALQDSNLPHGGQRYCAGVALVPCGWKHAAGRKFDAAAVCDAAPALHFGTMNDLGLQQSGGGERLAELNAD
jgi:hypothetical protein